jgi:hypothetical protein
LPEKAERQRAPQSWINRVLALVRANVPEQ